MYTIYKKKQICNIEFQYDLLLNVFLQYFISISIKIDLGKLLK